MSVCHENNKSICIWKEDIRLGILIKKRGNYLKGMGFHKAKIPYLHPEECLFLVDRGALKIFQYIEEFDRLDMNGITQYILEKELKPISLKDSYQMILNNELPIYKYLVYSHLKRLGYILQKTDIQELENKALVSFLKKVSVNSIKIANFATPAEKIKNMDDISRNLIWNNMIKFMYNRERTNFEYFPQYCIWQPNHQFKASNPGPCYRYILIVRANDIPISPLNLMKLSNCFDSIPIILAIVDNGYISFLEIEPNSEPSKLFNK